MRQRIYNRHALKPIRQALRARATDAEEVLWKRLRGRQLCGWKFRRQYSAGPYVLDFYCPAARVAIELDGSIHDEPMQIAHDLARDAFLNSLGISVLRFKNRDVFTHCHAVTEVIIHHLEGD